MDEDREKWEKRRSLTYRVYLVQSIFMGLELIIIQATLLDYLKTSVKPDNVNLWYDVINAILYVSPILFGSLVGRWMDNHRNLRLSLIMLNIVVLAGSVLYMIPFSAFFPLFGRFLHGFHYIIRSLIYAEISRIFPGNEVQRKIPAFQAGIAFGIAIGSLSNMIFLNVNVWLGDLKLTYGNASSVPLLIYSVVQIFLLTFCSYNVSEEYDLKEDENKCDGYVVKGKRNFVDELKGLLCPEFILLMAMSIHSGFGITLFPRIYPLVVQELGYDNAIVNYGFLADSLFGTFLSLIITKMELTSFEVFANGYASIIAFLFTTIGFQLTSVDLPFWLNLLLLGISLLSGHFFNVTSKTFLVVTCNKFIPSSSQSFGESLRANVTIASRLITALVTTLVHDNLLFVNIANGLVTLLFLTVMTVQRKSLSAPTTRL